jgi:hypothetical protein
MTTRIVKYLSCNEVERTFLEIEKGVDFITISIIDPNLPGSYIQLSMEDAKWIIKDLQSLVDNG